MQKRMSGGSVSRWIRPWKKCVKDGTSLKIIEKYLDDPKKYLEVDDLGY